jgi:hypothetical protein
VGAGVGLKAANRHRNIMNAARFRWKLVPSRRAASGYPCRRAAAKSFCHCCR